MKIKIKKNQKENKEKKRSLFSNFGIGEEKDYFIDNFTMLMVSGMNVISALDSIEQEIRSIRMKKIIEQMKEDVGAGISIWEALSRSNLFPEYIISLIKMGEKSGRLLENLKVITIQQKKERIFRSKIRSAMTYPAIVFMLSAVVGIGIAWFLLPRLATVFAQLNVELPFITRVLIFLGEFVGNYGAVVIPLLILFMVCLFYFLFYFPKTRFIGQKILFAFPGIKGLIQETELARSGYVLGTLLRAGLPIVNAINSLSDATTLHNYKNFYDFLSKNIEQGESFRESFKSFPRSRKLIPVPVQQMIISGEQSGNLSEVLIEIGDNYESKTETTTKDLTVILEPVMLVIVWLGVVGVALAIIMPIYSLIGGLNKSKNMPPPKKQESQIQESDQGKSVIIESNNASVEKLKPKIEIIKTETGYLNIRTEPNLKSRIIKKAFTGEVFVYEVVENGWYKVVFQDQVNINNSVYKEGWAYGKYVKIFEEPKDNNQDSENGNQNQ